MEKLDSVVSGVIRQFVNRAQIGRTKYGTDLDRKDLSLIEWIQHAQEEQMDSILYLEKIKQTLLADAKLFNSLDKVD